MHTGDPCRKKMDGRRRTEPSRADTSRRRGRSRARNDKPCVSSAQQPIDGVDWLFVAKSHFLLTNNSTHLY